MITNFKQRDITYMDDINDLSSSLEDLVIFDRVVKKFEGQSGFMLSRDKKTNVMGLGQWEGKMNWPLAWINSVSEIKVLGFVVCPKYQQTLQRTWKAVFRRFEKTLFSWSSRSIPTLQQRVTVLHTMHSIRGLRRPVDCCTILCGQ